MKSFVQVPANLRAIFLSNKLVFAGRSVQANLTRISNAWQFKALQERLQKTTESSFFLELGFFAKLKGEVKESSVDLVSLVGAILKHSLPGSDDIALSHWSSANLTPKQIDYAKLCVFSCFHLWRTLAAKPSIGQPIDDSPNGTPIHLYSGKTPVAEGRISARQAPLEVTATASDTSDDPMEIGEQSRPSETTLVKLTAARVVVTVDKILVPGHIISLHHGQTLATLEHFHPTPFDIIVLRRSVRTRASDPPVLTRTHPDEASLPDAPPFTGTELADDEVDLLTHNDGTTEDNPEDSVPDSVSGAESGNKETADRDDSSSANECKLSTRLFDDTFHFENRLLRLLSKMHSGFKEFARQFSRSMCLVDRNDLEAVRKIYEKKGISLSYAMRAHPDRMRKRIRTMIPPPNILIPRLRRLFETWADVVCSVDSKRGKLFNDAARHQADLLIRIAQMGLVSDPPGAQLYFLMGKDRDGLNMYRTIRGTSDIEGGLHMEVQRTFGSLQASPELTDSLLRNIRHRRNTSV